MANEAHSDTAPGGPSPKPPPPSWGRSLAPILVIAAVSLAIVGVILILT